MIAVVSPFVAQDQPNNFRPMDLSLIINSSYVNKKTHSIINLSFSLLEKNTNKRRKMLTYDL